MKMERNLQLNHNLKEILEGKKNYVEAALFHFKFRFQSWFSRKSDKIIEEPLCFYYQVLDQLTEIEQLLENSYDDNLDLRCFLFFKC